MIHCQDSVCVLNELQFEQPKLSMLERLTDRNGHDTNDTQSDITEQVIQVETDDIVLNESTSQPKELK